LVFEQANIFIFRVAKNSFPEKISPFRFLFEFQNIFLNFFIPVQPSQKSITDFLLIP